jgi:ketosteroid isomerase-like protein
MEGNKKILQIANEALLRGDNEGFLKHCSEDVVWDFVGDTILKGKDAVREWMTENYKETPRFEVTHIIAEDDLVNLMGTSFAKDELGNDVLYEACDVWRFRDGKMVELKAFVIQPKQ